SRIHKCIIGVFVIMYLAIPLKCCLLPRLREEPFRHIWGDRSGDCPHNPPGMVSKLPEQGIHWSERNHILSRPGGSSNGIQCALVRRRPPGQRRSCRPATLSAASDVYLAIVSALYNKKHLTGHRLLLIPGR